MENIEQTIDHSREQGQKYINRLVGVAGFLGVTALFTREISEVSLPSAGVSIVSLVGAALVDRHFGISRSQISE